MNISIVIPAYNEEDNIYPLYIKIKQAIALIPSLNQYEIIFIDDCSIDSTWNKMLSLKNEHIKIFKHEKNSGKSYALETGFKKSKYEIIVTMDADLQNDPSDMPALIKKINEGYDCVCGWRKERKDPFIKILASKIANLIRRFVIKDNFKDIGCGLRVFKKECLNNVKFFKGYHRFLPFLIQKQGYNVTEHPIKHHPRKFGKTKYGTLNRIFKTTFDLYYVKKHYDSN